MSSLIRARQVFNVIILSSTVSRWRRAIAKDKVSSTFKNCEVHAESGAAHSSWRRGSVLDPRSPLHPATAQGAVSFN